MVDATIDVIDRGVIETDLNNLVEGNTLGTHNNPNPDTDYVEVPVPTLVVPN